MSNQSLEQLIEFLTTLQSDSPVAIIVAIGILSWILISGIAGLVRLILETR
jgi:hypothetical protein